MKLTSQLFVILSLIIATSCKQQVAKTPEMTKPLKIVFVTGDEEYRSEESMPMLAQIAKRELNAEVKVCYALDSLGYIDPNRSDNIAGLEALEDADLMVLFTRFRALPTKQLKYITDYAESGRPMVGFRTSTHAFLYENDSSMVAMNNEWPTKVFGQQWITHHGHFDDGKYPVTEITITDATTKHPILNGFEKFKAYSWLYHVDGGAWKLYGDSAPILNGHSLKSKHEMEGNLAQFPLDNPVAWTKTYTGEQGKTARVFFTTLGHPYDFTLPVVRKISLNGMLWALGMESEIPTEGVNVSLDAAYEPNNSGFGTKFKPNQKPLLFK